jgi:pumilio family protein 6
MAGIKRKSPTVTQSSTKQSKKLKVEKSTKKAPPKEESEDLVESDTSEDEHGYFGFAAKEEGTADSSEDDSSDSDEQSERTRKAIQKNTESKTASDQQKPSALENLNGRVIKIAYL